MTNFIESGILRYVLHSQTLQHDQKAEIARLEQDVHSMRGKHSEAIQKLKSQFLREKRSYQKESDTKIHEMAQQASQVCVGNLNA